MEKINKTKALYEAIALLEIKRATELRALKDQLHDGYESLKPVNILKNTFKEVTSSPDLKKGLGTAAMGIASGYLMKNIFIHSTKNPLMRLAGLLIQTATTNMVVKNSDTIRESGGKILHAITSKILSSKKVLSEDGNK
jgi:hypothetical protein